MKRLLPLLAAATLTLSACGADAPKPAETPTLTTSSSSKPSTTTSKPSSSAPKPSSSTKQPTSSYVPPAPETPVVEQTTAAPAPQQTAQEAQPTFVSCWENGYAQLSDISVVEWPDCALPEEDASQLGPDPDPATIPYADGGTCPAYKCGYGHDENGNFRPDNTEIQSWWGQCIAMNSTEYCRENDPYQQ